MQVDILSLIIGVVIGVVAGIGVLVLMGGGWSRLMQGIAIAKKAAQSPETAAKLQELLLPPAPVAPARPDGTALRLLALLQREARLLDFLLEDLSAYTDAQIGASVRDIHQKSKKVIRDHVTLEPVLPQTEGASVTVPVGFDPSAIRLLGNVTGQAPFTGTLQHHGWRCKSFSLAKPSEGQDEMVLSPAEVELPM